ncbi:MAG: beta-ketoacyl-[acyl-carrier-protein] synthase family protein [Planctomycetes bacterium]|jgi:3-oxoacyl-[acyl-carrier-protein] synthase II|nr:beta-ketoacyl-[acyl-carrier-protein] synthase family protein [Planctomycetota bacterium]
MRHRVVITGMGVVCPLGHNTEQMWKGLMTGQSGAAATTLFDASTFPTQFDAEVKGFDLSRFVRHYDLHKNGNRGTQFALGACVQACQQAGIDVETSAPGDGIDRQRMGIYLGAGEGPVNFEPFFEALIGAWDEQARQVNWPKWTQIALSGLSALNELEQEPNMPVAHLALLTGARGVTRSCLTACAASTQAVGEAMMLLRHGKADVIVAGGAHSMIHPLGVTGFNRLTALSTRNDSPQTASRPFSASRDGFVIGEGGAIVILETLESAKKRGVKILAEVIGFGSSNDAFRVTDMHNEARGACQALRAAIRDAGLTIEDIDYISTHGTSTVENDEIETLAIKTVFGQRAYTIPCSSPKSQMGHLIAATGCAELITCVKAIEEQTLPPTMNLNEPDPKLDLDYVPNVPRKAKVEIALNESFGFGGQNNVIIIKRFQEDTQG